MKKLITCACLGLLFAAATPAFAAGQQDRMKSCNKDAADKALKGDERKKFMKECLSKKAEAPAEKKADAAPADKKTAQQEKMKNCNKDAADKGLKGDERKKFMSSCLKG